MGASHTGGEAVERLRARGFGVTMDRGRVAYAAQGLGLVFYVLTIWAEVYLDTGEQGADSADVFRESHRRWRLRTSLLFFTWTILGGLTLPFGFGLPVIVVAYLWFGARVTIGWSRWERGLAVGGRTSPTHRPLHVLHRRSSELARHP